MPGNKDITHDELIKLLHLPEKLVAKELGICLTSLKKTCRIHGILRWPYRKIKSLDKKLSKLESAMTAPGTSKEDQSSLKEKLDQLQKERKNLPYRPARSVSSSADLEEDEASNSDSDRSSPVSTPSTVVASPSAMATAAAETEGGFEREANKLEKKLMQQKIRQAKKAKTANGKSNGHAGGVVEGQVTHVIPLPSLMNQQQSGGDSSMKLELTLPADIAEEISKGRATFKIVQNPGQTPELHLISLVTEEPTLEEDFFDMDDNMLPDDQDLDLQPFGDDTGHQDHDHSLDDSLLSMGDAHAARAESEENKNSNHAPVNHAPIVHAPAAKVATGNPVGDLNGVKKEQRPASAAEVLCGALSPGVGTGSSAWVRPKQSQTNGNSETSSAAQPHPVDIVSPNSASVSYSLRTYSSFLKLS